MREGLQIESWARAPPELIPLKDFSLARPGLSCPSSAQAIAQGSRIFNYELASQTTTSAPTVRLQLRRPAMYSTAHPALPDSLRWTFGGVLGRSLFICVIPRHSATCRQFAHSHHHGEGSGDDLLQNPLLLHPNPLLWTLLHQFGHPAAVFPTL